MKTIIAISVLLALTGCSTTGALSEKEVYDFKVSVADTNQTVTAPSDQLITVKSGFTYANK